MDSGKDHQLMLKPLDKWFLEKHHICALKELPPKKKSVRGRELEKPVKDTVWTSVPTTSDRKSVV